MQPTTGNNKLPNSQNIPNPAAKGNQPSQSKLKEMELIAFQDLLIKGDCLSIDQSIVIDLTQSTEHTLTEDTHSYLRSIAQEVSKYAVETVLKTLPEHEAKTLSIPSLREKMVQYVQQVLEKENVPFAKKFALLLELTTSSEKEISNRCENLIEEENFELALLAADQQTKSNREYWYAKVINALLAKENPIEKILPFLNKFIEVKAGHGSELGSIAFLLIQKGYNLEALKCLSKLDQYWQSFYPKCAAEFLNKGNPFLAFTAISYSPNAESRATYRTQAVQKLFSEKQYKIIALLLSTLKLTDVEDNIWLQGCYTQFVKDLVSKNDLAFADALSAHSAGLNKFLLPKMVTDLCIIGKVAEAQYIAALIQDNNTKDAALLEVKKHTNLMEKVIEHIPEEVILPKDALDEPSLEKASPAKPNPEVIVPKPEEKIGTVYYLWKHFWAFRIASILSLGVIPLVIYIWDSMFSGWKMKAEN